MSCHISQEHKARIIFFEIISTWSCTNLAGCWLFDILWPPEIGFIYMIRITKLEISRNIHQTLATRNDEQVGFLHEFTSKVGGKNTQHEIYDGLGSEKMIVFRTGDFISRCKLAKHHVLYIFTWQQKWFVFWWDYTTANIPLQNGASWVSKRSYPKISDINMSEENPHVSVTISRYFLRLPRPEIMGALNKDTLRSLDAQCGRWSSWTVFSIMGQLLFLCSIVDIGGVSKPIVPL